MLKYIFVGVFGLSVLLATSPAKAQAPICGEREQIIQAIKNRFQEVETEYGLDGRSESYVGVYVNAKTKDFTFTMTPKGQPSVLCAIASGTQWEQLPGISKGIISDGSLISISYNEDSGLWQLMYVNIETGNISMVTSGNSWERVVEFTDSSI